MNVADHNSPFYEDDASTELIMYSGVDVTKCADSNGEHPGYNGHSGVDYSRDPRPGQRQGCGTGEQPQTIDSLVYAADDGTVFKSRWDQTVHDGEDAEYGLHIDIDHGGSGDDALRSLYGHLAVLMVEEGESVSKGQLIGAVGNTGNSSPAHLHFQAAHGSDASVSNNSFDPYGWNTSYTATPGGAPSFADPHHRTGWAQRLIHPGESGPTCPNACAADVFVDDADTARVTFKCSGGSGTACADWKTSGDGDFGGSHFVKSNGGSVKNFAEYRCTLCGAGTYLILADVPFSAESGTTHIARYEIGGEVAIMDQHEEGPRYHPLGIYTFSSSTPMVRVTDRTDRYNYTAPSSQAIAADVVVFRKICGGIPSDTPVIPSDWGE